MTSWRVLRDGSGGLDGGGWRHKDAPAGRPGKWPTATSPARHDAGKEVSPEAFVEGTGPVLSGAFRRTDGAAATCEGAAIVAVTDTSEVRTVAIRRADGHRRARVIGLIGTPQP